MNKSHVHKRSRTMLSGLPRKNEIPITLCHFWETFTGSQLDTVTAFSKTEIVNAGKSITLMPVFHHLSVFFSLILPLLLYQSSCSPSILQEVQQNYLSQFLRIKKKVFCECLFMSYSYTAPSIWNLLSADMRVSSSLQSLKSENTAL